jgi:Family of unknown function (DUF6174)
MSRTQDWRLGALFTLWAVSACSEGPFGARDGRDLAEATARWAGAGVGDYRVEVRTSCFCITAVAEFTELEVRDGQVVRARSLGSEPSNEEIPLDAWPTVAGAFELVENAARDDEVYSEIAVEYDPLLGYPRVVTLTCHPELVDCGL